MVTGAAGEQVLRGQRLRDVLAVLCLRRGRTVRAEELAVLVWGEDARTPVASVHTVVSRVRRALGSGAIETSDRGYHLTAEVTLDLDDLDRALQSARGAMAAGDLDRAILEQRRALALWRGEVAFEGVRDELVVADRVRIEEERAHLVEDLSATLVERAAPGDVREAHDVVVRLLARHPLRETSCRLAMVTAYRDGRQADALALHRDLTTLLREELGVDPSPETDALLTRILRQDPGLTPTEQELGVLAARPRRSLCLPALLTPTIGREADGAAVRGLLGDGRRLVTVTGPGGVGKTRLALQLAHDLSADREVAFVDLSGLSTPTTSEVAARIALDLDLKLAHPAGDAVDGLIDAIGGQCLVLVLDEAETAGAAATDSLTRLLAGCPSLSIVATSRLPLDIPGESRMVLTPLGCPADGATDDEIEQAPAVRLLRHRLRDQALDVADDSSAVSLLAEIVRRVDGLPLAVELLAVQAATRSLTELAELDAPTLGSPLTGGRPHRHQSLRETVTASTRNLSAREYRVLGRLCVFAGSFEMAAAQAVVGAEAPTTERDVQALVRASLLQVDRRGDRAGFRMLKVVRDIVSAELAGDPGQESARARHRWWYAARWRGAPLHDELIADVGRFHDDFVAALRNSLVARDADALGDLALTLGRHWLYTEAVATGLTWLDRALQSGLVEDPAAARLLTVRTGLQLHWGWQECVDTVEGLPQRLRDDPEWLTMALVVRLVCAYLAGDYARAVADAEQAVRVSRDGAPALLPEALASAAVMLVSAGQRDRALAAADEAWGLVGVAPTATHVVSVMPKIALALAEAGQHARALAVLTRAETIGEERLGLRPTSPMLINAGWAALGAGEPALAARWIGRLLLPPTPLPRGLWLAESALVAACALAHVGGSDPADLLACADELTRRTALALSPAMEAAREQAGPPTPVRAAEPLTAWAEDELAEQVVGALASALASGP